MLNLINLVYATGFQVISTPQPAVNSIVDVQLMLTLAQISATFIAITAGFYTTKIISIVNEKSRINAKIREYETEKNLLREEYERFYKRKDEIDSENMNRFIESFKGRVLDEEKVITSLEDLKTYYINYYDAEPSEKITKIFQEILPELTKTSKEREKKRNEEFKKMLYDAQHGTDTYRREVPALFSRVSDNWDVVRTMERQDDDRKYEEILKRMDSITSRLLMIEELISTLRHELNSIVYPKHIKFGFRSFIIFAFLGVIIPISYGSWGQLLILNHLYSIPANMIVLILFGVGLAFNLAYIYLELRVALKPHVQS